MPDDTLTFEKLRQAERTLRGALGEPLLFASRPVMSLLEALPKPDPMENLFGPSLGSYFGIRLFKAPEYLYRQPDKPLRSRPRRKWVRAVRKSLRADRPKLRRLYRVSSSVWKTRKVPDRRGYSQNTFFLFNPGAI